MDEGLADRVEDVALGRGQGQGQRRGRGGKRGGGGRGSKARTPNTEVSRALSKLLRHQAAQAGIPLDDEGYAPLDRVLQWGPLRGLAPTFEDIQSVVRDCDKQRFTLKLKPNPVANTDLDEASTAPADWLIRANQGHSIKVASDGLLRPLVLVTDSGSGSGSMAPEKAVPVPPVVVHGTYFCFWPAILASGGLRPMGRNHVHFSTGLPPSGQGDEAVISGMRRDAELLVYVDVARSIRDAGIKWWMSDNGVVLTEGDEDGLVPLRFFGEVVGRRPDVVGVLWRDGEKVADLPEGLKMEVPRGKERLRGGSS